MNPISWLTIIFFTFWTKSAIDLSNYEVFFFRYVNFQLLAFVFLWDFCNPSMLHNRILFSSYKVIGFLVSESNKFLMSSTLVGTVSSNHGIISSQKTHTLPCTTQRYKHKTVSKYLVLFDWATLWAREILSTTAHQPTYTCNYNWQTYNTRNFSPV